MRYREAVANDVAELVRLWVMLRDEEAAYYPDVKASPLHGLEIMAHALRTGSTYVGVLEETEGVLRGFIHCDSRPAVGRNEKSGVVVACYVEPDFRHLHKSIWTRVEQWAKAFGIVRLQFQTLSGNPYMERFAKNRARPVSVIYEMNLNPENEDGRGRERSQRRESAEIGREDRTSGVGSGHSGEEAGGQLCRGDLLHHGASQDPADLGPPRG